LKVLDSEQNRLKLVLNILVVVLSLYGVAKREMIYDETSQFENLLMDFFGPMQRSVTFLKRKTGSLLDYYVLNINASKENGQLRNRVDELQNKIFQLDEISKENKRLKGLLDFNTDVKGKKVLAQIVAWDASSDYKAIRINKGQADGIKLQSPVVTTKGLVGYIFRLTDNFADVLTILDANNRVDGIVSRIRSHGIIEGFSGNKCLMKYIGRTEAVILNDMVVTSGLGNIYPKGVLIGNVSRIERENYGITQYIEVTPSVEFSKLEEVIVLVSAEASKIKKEWEALDNSEEKE